MSCWDLLGVPEGSDISEIKKAYAKLLKKCHPEDDAEGYQELREAYNRAKNVCANSWKLYQKAFAEYGFKKQKSKVGNNG